MKEIQGKSILGRVSGRFEFTSEGSSYRESTVLIQCLFAAFDYYDRWEKIQLRLIANTSRKLPPPVSDHFVMCTKGGHLDRV